MRPLSTAWKQRLARLVRHPLMRRGLIWGITLFAPRQRVGVVVVLENEAKQVLMLNHVFHPDAPWGLPGGWLGRDEDPAVGALRELKEETGLSAEIVAPVLLSHEPRPAHIGIAYLARPISAEITLSAEIIEARWVNKDDLPTPLLPIYRKAIAAANSVQNRLMEAQNIDL